MYKVRFTSFGGGRLCGDRAGCWASHLSIFIQAPRPAPTESEIQSWREMKNVPEVNLEAKDNRKFENVNETFCLLWPLCDVLTWICSSWSDIKHFRLRWQSLKEWNNWIMRGQSLNWLWRSNTLKKGTRERLVIFFLQPNFCQSSRWWQIWWRRWQWWWWWQGWGWWWWWGDQPSNSCGSLHVWGKAAEDLVEISSEPW